MGMVGDGLVAGTPPAAVAAVAAAGGQGGQEPLLSGIGEAELGREVRNVLGGEASVEAKKGKLQDMSESLSGLVGRRRRGKKGSSRSSGSGSLSPSPSPAPSSRRTHDDAARDGAGDATTTRTL
ncbi:hypothetical protein GJ744_010888 [Endocarpon pusillum]|uniref:Uncharacterized protein n=1 Tax=Endocarpon pusillum TaxID=364733 RepID=A0A8H7E585_9EURO|nr:hypothetical protein GJ744_010888 [Endocarpon pusillum]